MQITICCSSSFHNKLPEIMEQLEKDGHEIFIPVIEASEERGADRKIKLDLIRKHFEKIEKSDAILVLNYDKNNIKDYIGGNSFLEMGKAFDRGIKIFLLNPVPEIGYREEILAMQPIILNGDLSKIGE